MRNARPIRRVVAEQLDGRHGVDLTAIAHAFEEEFGVELPPEQVRRIGSYSELLQLLFRELGHIQILQDAAPILQELQELPG